MPSAVSLALELPEASSLSVEVLAEVSAADEAAALLVSEPASSGAACAVDAHRRQTPVATAGVARTVAVQVLSFTGGIQARQYCRRDVLGS